MKSTASFLSAQPEVAQQFLSNTRFSLKAADTPADKYDVILNVSRSFAEGFAPAVAPFKEWLEMVKSAEEEYMPSGPPMSPVTHNFFLQWSITDLRFGPGNETLADCVKALLSSVKATKADRLTLSLISQIASSRIGIYEVMKSDSKQTQLQDIVTEEVFVCGPSSAKKGTQWLTRVLPHPEDDTRHFVAIEPYVLQGHTRVEWLRMLQQQAAGHGITVEELLKFGHAGLSWLEYLLQSYLGVKDGFILLAGNLTDPRTRAHSNGDGLAPRYRATGLALPVFEFHLTPAQRKLVAKEFPEMEPELQLKKSGRQPVALNPESLLRLREFVSIYTRVATGSALSVGRSLAQELDERIEELAEVLGEHLGEDDEDACQWMAEAKDLLFKFTLEDTGVEVVRYVKVPAHYDLRDLHNLLQVAFGWDSSHLHIFDIDGDRFTEPEAPVEDCYDEEDVKLSCAFSHSLQGVYLYDMGDSWEVSMQILRGYQQGDGLPLLVAGRGPNAVEDCGGAPGFEELLRLLKNPRLKDPHGLRDMVDDSYDPVQCPSEEIQRRLIEAFRDDWAEEGELLYIKRHPAEGFSVQGKPTDVVIAVESEELKVVGAKAYLRSDGPEVAVEVVREALGKVRAPDTLVVDDKDLAKVLKKNFALKVRVRKSIPELGPVLGELESYMSRPYAYFEHIPQDILADFLQAAYYYYLHPL